MIGALVTAVLGPWPKAVAWRGPQGGEAALQQGRLNSNGAR